MNNAFYVVPIGGGDHVFASNILSECSDIARYFTRVEIVDMFGEVWMTVDNGNGQPSAPLESPPGEDANATTMRGLPRRWMIQGLSSISM